MATFTASPLSDPTPQVQVNLPADYAAAQQLQQGQNQLTMQGQQVSDMQQAVALRPQLEAGNPQAWNQLSVIDPSQAQGLIAARSAAAQMPYNMLQRQSQTMAEAAQGVVTAAPADKQAAYQQMLATVRPYGLGGNLPDQYPGDGALQQIALFGADPGKILNYLQSRPYLGGASRQPSGVTPAGGGVNNPGNLRVPGQMAFQSFPTPQAGVAATENQLLLDNTQHGLKTVAQIVNSWAPPSDNNNTAVYTAAVAQKLGVDPNQPIDLTNPALRSQFAQAIFQQEGHPISDADMQGGAAPPAGTQAGYVPGGNSLSAPAGPGSYAPGSPSDVTAQNASIAPAIPNVPSVPVMKNGVQVTDSNGNGLVQYNDGTQGYVPLTGGASDPNIIRQQAQIQATAKAAPNAPFVGGPTAQPPAQIAAGPFPPRASPYAGMQNNPDLGSQVSADRKDAQATVAADQPVISKDIANIQFDQQFHDINANNPTGVGLLGGAPRTIAGFVGGKYNDGYQELDKLNANLKTASLPSNLGRLDLPIIKAVGQQQPSVTNSAKANNDIEQIQIAQAQRDIDYRQSRAEYVQQFGDLHGFDTMWNAYINQVPGLNKDAQGQVTVNTAAPKFTDWVASRGGQQPPQGPQQPTPQTQQASAPAQSSSGLAALEGHMVSQGGHTFKITNGVPVLVQ